MKGNVLVSTIEDKGIDIPMEEINNENSDSETKYVVSAKPKSTISLRTPRLDAAGVAKAVEAIKTKKIRQAEKASTRK